MRICDQINVPAVAAITAAGTAFRDEFFPAECDATVPTVARFDRNVGLVDEQLFYRLDGDESARTTLVFELNDTGYFSK